MPLGFKETTTHYISFEDDYSPPHYKKVRPKDRALLMVQDEVVCILDYIGPGLEFLRTESPRNFVDEFIDVNEGVDLCLLEGGVYIWEGQYVTDKLDTYYGYEYDYYLEGTVRKATKEELKYYQTEECAWDPDEWYEKAVEDV